MSRSSKRILVTGGAGFIGSHLCERHNGGLKKLAAHQGVGIKGG